MNFQLDQYLKELEELVNIDSFCFDPEGANRVVDVFEAKCKELGLYTQRVFHNEAHGDSLLVCNVEDKEDTRYDFMLCGHIDTVFKRGTAAERPFKIEGKRAYGPGIADMKAGALNMYYVMKNIPLKEDGTPYKVCALFNSHEECGSTYSTEWMKEYAAKSNYGLVFEPARGNGEYVNERRGIMRVSVDIEGKAAHAGNNPQDGISASKELGDWIAELYKLESPENGTSVNFGKINSYNNPANIVCEHVTFDVDVRLKQMDERDKVVALLKHKTEKPLVDGIKNTYNVLIDWAPFVACERAKQMASIINDIYHEMDLGDAMFIASGGGSDANGMTLAGIPIIDACGPSGFYFHSVDEYLEIESIEPKIKVILELMKRL